MRAGEQSLFEIAKILVISKKTAQQYMGESSKNRLDEYDPVIEYHHLKFENRCLRASGDDFQNLFEAIMVRARPGEFERVRPYGKYGDRKCDGLIESEGIIFQVYSPDELKQAEVQKKIDEDLEGAVQHWSDILKKWVFVYNAKRGTTADIKLTLQQKRQQYPDIEIDCWSNDYLWEIVRGLSLQQRCEILGAPPQWNLGKPKKNFHVPNSPSHLLERFKDLGVLKNLLLSDSNLALGTAGSVSKIGMYGMGGIGKSVLAGMLARDEEVQAAFPDGVFWLPLGQEPSLTLKQLNFAQMLGDTSLPFQDVQQGKIHLSQLLDQRQCLLILDDVWQVEHTAAFDVLGEQSKLLFTTRDSRIVKALNAIEYQVNLLSDDEALELLATCSGQAKEALPVEAHEVMQECGNLPLALSMIGAIAKARPNRWDNLLHKLQNADLDKIRHQFPDYPYPDLLKVIQVSVNALEPEAKIRYLDFAVFPEDVPIPEATLRTFWEPEGLNEYDTQDVIDTLVERSLVQQDEIRNVSLHNLQHSYVKKLTSSILKLHNKLLEAYSAYCPQGWQSYLKNDDYFFKNLAYHLKQAKRENELNTLLTASPNWMRTKFDRYKNHAFYAVDLELAISDFQDPLKINDLLILVQIKAAQQLIYGWVNRYTNIDLETLVWLGHEREAEGYAELRFSEENRLYGLLTVYQALHIKGKLKQNHLENLLQNLDAILSKTDQKNYKCPLAEWALFLIKNGLIANYNFISKLIELLEDDRVSQDRVWLALIIKSIEVGEVQGIERLLLVARKTSSYKTSNTEKIRGYCDLGLAFFNAEYIAEADSFFLEAREVLNEIQEEMIEGSLSVETGIEALLKFAETLLQLNAQEHVVEANQLLARAQRILFKTEEYFAKAYLSELIVATLSNIGRLDEAKELGYSIPSNSSHRADALSKLANSFAKNGNLVESSLFLKEATNSRYINSKWLFESIMNFVQLLKDLDYETEAEVISALFIKSSSPIEGGLVSIGEIVMASCGNGFILHNKFVQMFSLMGLYGIENFLYTMTSLSSSFEEIESGLSLKALREVIRIAGWVNEDWQKIYEIVWTQEINIS